MFFAIPSPSCTTHPFVTGLYSCGVAAKDCFHATIQKIKKIVTSPFGQLAIGLGLGMCMPIIYAPLTGKIVKGLGVSTTLTDPFSELGLIDKIFLTPFVCILIPIGEEVTFREGLQGELKNKLESLYVALGLPKPAANSAARVTSIFFTSVIFGLMHFSNAAIFVCNPVVFLPQVVAAILMGIILGLAKEFTGEVYMPTSMHIGNNLLSWIRYIKMSL
ncbi:CPBP family intramembrane glutamic endopeptidase [Parachlamydia sp. AcF125]|uniref:CPBP family intramembrane glutamic endopeptidase n=1 Tax=Parachlamydia sp. AcF125 TaxID=2795736 RepID=UPI001BC92CB0|nr:CPBP family intramembrane glutamic endopeptidase [Parachlamydia sp. AcF125]MBS4167404.1 hypothetical protein [Parachlamydia sp. AcF125]